MYNLSKLELSKLRIILVYIALVFYIKILTIFLYLTGKKFMYWEMLDQTIALQLKCRTLMEPVRLPNVSALN